jgi:peptidoglycan/xylan/chitin deacetylase (PgdA/CDA1 family)
MVKWRAADALFATGFGGSLHRNRPGGRIIVYHGVDAVGSLEHNTRFISEATLRYHLEYFRHHFQVVSLADFAAGRRAPNRLTIAVTFDDGYLNNLERALPIIESIGVPVAVFVTGCAKTDGGILWPDLLDIATPAIRDRVEIAGEEWLRGRRGELIAASTGEFLKLRCKRSSLDFIREMAFVLEPFFDERGPDRLADYWRHLDTDGIRRLADSDLVTIGSHGAHHLCLGAIEPDMARGEVEHSKTYLEAAIDDAVVDFAFPDGSYTRNVVEMVADAGFKRQYAVDFLHPEDHEDPCLFERMGHNPFISWNNQLWSILEGRY